MCKRLDAATLSDSGVIKQLEQFVPIKIDADQDRAMLTRFHVRSFPAILFVTARGKRVGKISFLPPKQFADRLQEIITVHRELSDMTAKFKADPTDLETGGRIAAAYAVRGEFIQARSIIRKLESADPENNTGVLTDAYLAVGDYYLDFDEARYTNAIRWYQKVVERGHNSAAVADARYRIGLAYFHSRTGHEPRTKKFGQQVHSAQGAIEAMLAMSDVPEALRQQAQSLMQQIRAESAKHEALRRKD